MILYGVDVFRPQLDTSKAIGFKNVRVHASLPPELVPLGVADLGCRRRRLRRLFACNLEFSDIAALAGGTVGSAAPRVARLTAA
jgi:hypothetical protein